MKKKKKKKKGYGLFERAMNNCGKRNFKGSSPHYTSFQNNTLEPSPTSYRTWCTKPTHPLLIHCHTPTSWGPPTSLEHQSPLILPYLMSTNFLHNACISIANLHNHLASKAQLNWSMFLTPNPPEFFGVHTFDQFTRWNWNSSLIPPQRKFLWSF